MDYNEFLLDKSQAYDKNGFSPVFMPDFLFDFQKYITEKALLHGRFAVFADCGMGKTPMQLVWSENVVRKTNKNILILTPAAVSAQTIREAEKFGIEAKRSLDGTAFRGITVTNYEKLHKFNPNDFVGAVCDESSILKNYDGAIKNSITSFVRKMSYRLLVTATAAPNDFIELGTSSEALGYLGYVDMLNRFFRNDQNNSSLKGGHALNQESRGAKWRFKGHAEMQFWKWVCSWALAVRKPSDIGFDNSRFVLPELIETEHAVETDYIPDGMLFSMPAVGLKEQRQERARTIEG